ncbi:Uncharacterised protein [Pseudomonas aeruginosa]|nr:Uncharacterised protein [Pseudomonas aeruginosa]
MPQQQCTGRAMEELHVADAFRLAEVLQKSRQGTGNRFAKAAPGPGTHRRRRSPGWPRHGSRHPDAAPWHPSARRSERGADSRIRARPEGRPILPASIPAKRCNCSCKVRCFRANCSPCSRCCRVQPPQRPATVQGSRRRRSLLLNRRSLRASTTLLRAPSTRASSSSPGSPPLTNQVIPASWAIPRPSWARRSMVRRCFLPTGIAGPRAHHRWAGSAARPLFLAMDMLSAGHRRRKTGSGRRGRR